MSGYGITAYGAYVPRLRLDRAAVAAAHRWMAPALKGLAKGERAFCSWDEDAITMAVEAARGAVGRGDSARVESVTLASTTLPYADVQNAVVVAGALGLSDAVRTTDMGGSQRAGVAGLVQALRGSADALFIASDRLRAKPASTQEMTYGAGAAGFRLGSDKVLARLVGCGVAAASFVDHIRAAGSPHDYVWEERWIRDEGYAKLAPLAATRALADAGVGIGDVATLAFGSPLRGAAAALGKALGFAGTVGDGLDAEVGYTGTAHSLLILTDVLAQAKPGERILLVGFGQGAEAAVLEVTEEIAAFRTARGLRNAVAAKITTTDYLRMLSFYDEIALDWGMRSEKSGKAALTGAYREAGQLAAFVAGRCPACAQAQFPQLAYCVTPGCAAPSKDFTPVPLSEEPAKVLTWTADRLSFHPAPPLYVGFIQFDLGARLLMETVDVGPEGIDVGTRVQMVFRIKEPDKARGYNRYFWKAQPLASCEATAKAGET